MQRKFISKIIQISDVVEWANKGEINFSPKYQRNSVWNQNAKSYLIDTIIRGMPIPPVFLHQRIDINTKKNNREIIDGQQRLRTIIEYIVDEKFHVYKKHNLEIGSLKYSELDDDLKKELLQYEIIAQVINEENDSIIYDMFSRLNSNNVVLNKQELRNAKFWGDFKVLSYQLATDYREFLIEQKVFKEHEISRMKDVEFISSLIILLLKGIISENSSALDEIYSEYDDNFENIDEIRASFNSIMADVIDLLEPYNDRKVIFNNKNYFYTLFAIVSKVNHNIVTLSDIGCNTRELGGRLSNKLYNFISNIENALSKDTSMLLVEREVYQKLDELHRKHTTDKNKRIARINLLLDILDRD